MNEILSNKALMLVAVIFASACSSIDRNIGTDLMQGPPSLTSPDLKCTPMPLPDLSLTQSAPGDSTGLMIPGRDTFDAGALPDGRKVVCFLGYPTTIKGEAILRGVYRGSCNWPDTNPTGEGCPVCHETPTNGMLLWRCAFTYSAAEERCQVNRLAVEWRGTNTYVPMVRDNEYGMDHNRDLAPEVIFNPEGCKKPGG